MLETVLLSRWGGYLIMVVLLGLIVLLLRVLFGPRGFFRDPLWDKRNREIRKEEAAARAARLKTWKEKTGSDGHKPITGLKQEHPHGN